MKSFSIALLLLCGCLPFVAGQSITWSEHIAPIVYAHCTNCHRPGEIAPFPLTSYDEAAAWGGMIQYVTEIRYMPPWKADPGYGAAYLKENYLSDAEIAAIKTWVEDGMPRGDTTLEPEVPVFPTGSQIGTPDLVLSFAHAHEHPGTNYDEYRYFVLPSGLTTPKNLVALEMRPGNKAIVHHALIWADTTGTAAALDAQTPEYGYVAEQGGGISSGQASFGTQLPGYVPGVRPHVYTNGIAQRVPAQADLVVQIHYAPTTTNEWDSSSFNLFFTDQPVSRYVQSKIMMPFGNTLINGPFAIPANQTREFHGVWKVPQEVSLLGVAPHMHLLGTHWKIYAVTPALDTIPLLRINDWDFNWQGGFYVKNLIRLPANTEIHALAGYDNTTANPLNPNNPPKLMTWGESTTDEMYYLPLLFVPYQTGDETLVLEDVLNGNEEAVFHFSRTKLYPVAPNPAGGTVKVGYTLEQTMPVSLGVYDVSGKLVEWLAPERNTLGGEHILNWNTTGLSNGIYCLVLRGKNGVQTQRLVIRN